jgi:hypothetical protein
MSQPQNCDTIRLLVPITIQPPARYLPSAPLSTAASNGLSGKLFEPKASFSRAVTCEARKVSMALFAIDGDVGCLFFFLGEAKRQIFLIDRRF